MRPMFLLIQTRFQKPIQSFSRYLGYCFLTTLLAVHLEANASDNHATSFNEQLNRAIQQTQSGQYIQALANHQKLYQYATDHSQLSSLELSVGFDAWYELAQKYPPALTSLSHIRNESTSRIEEGIGTLMDYQQVCTINRLLKEEQSTYELFKYVHKKYPEAAQYFYAEVQNLLVDKKDYDLFLNYVKDPIFAVESLRHAREEALSRIRLGLGTKEEMLRVDQEFESQLKNLLQALMALNQINSVSEVLRRATQYYGEESVNAVKQLAVQAI